MARASPRRGRRGSRTVSWPSAPGSGHGLRSSRCRPSSGRRRSRAASAILRYVVSLPPATLSIPPALLREDRLAPRAHALPGPLQGGRGCPAYVERTPPGRASGSADRARRPPHRRICRPPIGSTVTASRLPRARGVGRSEDEHPGPRHGEGDADLVLGNGQRRPPLLVAGRTTTWAPLLSRTDAPPSGSSSRRT